MSKKSIIIAAVVIIVAGGAWYWSSFQKDKKENATLRYSIDDSQGDEAGQLLMNVEYNIDPEPSLDNKSKLKIKLEPIADFSEIFVDFTSNDNYILSPNEESNFSFFQKQDKSIEKELEFLKFGPSQLVANIRIIWPNGETTEKSLFLYFYIPNKEDLNNEIPRVSKFPTSAHDSIKIE